MDILVLLLILGIMPILVLLLIFVMLLLWKGHLRVKGIVSFLDETFEVDLIDPDFLSRVVLINAGMKRMVGRNNYRDERFIIEVIVPWNMKKSTIDNDHELYQIWQLYNKKKFIEIVFDMTIIPLNVMNVIKRRSFEDDIEDVAVGPDVEPESVLSVFQRQPIDNVEAQQQLHATATEKRRGKRKSVARKSSRKISKTKFCRLSI